MTKAELIELKTEFNRYAGILNVGLDKFIKKTKDNNDIVKFRNDSNIFDGFHRTHLLTKKFHADSGYSLNFMEDYDKTSKDNTLMLRKINKLELELGMAIQLLKDNKIIIK